MSNLDILLKEAMNAELEAKKFYTEASTKAKSNAGKKLFNELAEFEKNHFDRLQKMLESRQNNIENNKVQEPQKDFTIKPEIKGEFEPNKDEIVDIINLAIDAEKKAQERYNKIAEISNDKEGKKIFTKLALEERNHQRILEDEFYQLSNKGIIIWD
jgi:rubrerythrin